jgi:hypothetical protein
VFPRASIEIATKCALLSTFCCTLFDSDGQVDRDRLLLGWGVVIMKMIRSVNPRSMRFVTFISAIGWDCRGRLKVLAMVWVRPRGSLGLELDAVGERARVVLELGDEPLRRGEEHVVAEEARDGDQEARDRRQERGRDAGASVWMLAVCWTETALKASMTPQTVPRSPRNGAPETIDARKIMFDS